MESWWCSLSALLAFGLVLQLDALYVSPVENDGVCPYDGGWNPKWKGCLDKCYNDNDCGYNEKCCRKGCGRVCVDIRPTPVGRPGQCPKYVPSLYVKPCPDKCYNDYDCGYNEKCCYQGCGRTCVAVKREKPGVCPSQYPQRSSWSPNEHCVNKCSDDYSCPGNKKCCKFGCGQACLTPKPVFSCKPYPYCLYKQH